VQIGDPDARLAELLDEERTLGGRIGDVDARRHRSKHILRAMWRRRFLEATGGGLAGLTLVGPARAQVEPGDRAEWSASGPLEGREPRDPQAMTPEERAHAPVLVLPRQARVARPFDLVVQIGEPVHPMSEHHRVDWIEVAAGEARLFVVDLSPAVAYPIVRIPITLPATSVLTARARCSRHGVWRTRREITVR